MSRLLLVDKPIGPTSHDVVEQLRRGLKVKKAGHCGTLDPMASGLLLVLTGRATRLAEVFSRHEKRYAGTVRFGSATDSDDHSGRVIARRDRFELEAAAVDRALSALAARTSQRPPLYSAIKVAGTPLYKLARRGESDGRNLPERPVRVTRLVRTALRDRELDLELTCSAGTYVRALARDLGEILGIPAHLSALRRLGSGPFDVGAAASPDALLAAGPRAGLALERALAALPAVGVSAAYRERLRHGAQPDAGDLTLPEPLPAPGSWVRMIADGGELLALGRVEADPAPVVRLRRRLGGED
jgi:tRNA pseudouridine55 synthase